MNKKVIIYAGAGFGIFALGFVGGVFTGKYIFEKKADERADAEINERRNHYRELLTSETNRLKAEIEAIKKGIDEHCTGDVALEILKNALPFEDSDDGDEDKYEEEVEPADPTYKKERG